ncbi:MAG: DUF1553 domain-containing protein [Acidobacteria bacterium]|nr:DUF1553 domain-containing protein [Acidobacteriota bacterium]
MFIRNVKWLLATAICLSGLGAELTQSVQSQAQDIEFNRDIRPILSDKCWVCHGPDSKNKKLRLRLDSEAAALIDLGGGVRAIVPGHPEQSELIRRVNAKDETERMPPPDSGRKLTDREKELLREWIARGAKWRQHWSFIAPVRPTPPHIKNKAWGKNPIDAFVLERLETEGLQPSSEADRVTLLRRVSLDLTGLPPTPTETDDFLRDRTPQAYEKVVDRLLGSPRYGERMAFRWLDVARYADTSGYQSDRERQMWRWRDWVIDAFNRNLPYDRFVVEQLAGDLLPNPTIEQRLATGFNRNHRGNSEAGIIPEEFAVEYAIDRVETMATAFLGLTAGCARCHNHKYDPLSQREFYQLFAYFNSIPENGLHLRAGNTPPTMFAPSKAQQRELKQLDLQIAAFEKKFAAWEPRIQKAQQAWERSLAGAQHWFPRDGMTAHFTMDESDKTVAEGAAKYQQGLINQAAVFDGQTTLRTRQTAKFSETTPVTLSVWIYPTVDNAGAIVTCAQDADKSGEYAATENISDKAWMGAGYGLFLDAGKLHFNLIRNWEYDSIRVETKDKLALNEWHHLLASYDGRQTVNGVTMFVDGRPQNLKINANSIAEPFSITQPWRIGGAGGNNPRQFHGLIDDVRVYDAPLANAHIAILANPQTLVAIARTGRRTTADDDKLRGAFFDFTAPAEIRRAWRQLRNLRLRKTRLETAFPSVMVMRETDEPRPAFVLNRGSYDAPGEKVGRGVPAALPSLLQDAPNNRLGLARWLTQPSHPLTARVAVNRFWQMLFGVGIVKTAEDFGAQGEWPSHPALLDWLAVDFRESGWDVKSLLKTIVMSATYRQASRASTELITRDPENRLLARGPRLRLPAEVIRDQALFVSGLLVEQVGGPSVKTYQPAGLYDGLVSSGLSYHQDHGEKLYRRSLYTFWKRTIAPPLMANFDGSARETCVVREHRTNTPLQALNLMNDVTFVEAARMLAERAMREGGKTVEARLRRMFRLTTARNPTQHESRLLLANLNAQLGEFRNDPAKAARLLQVGEKKADAKLDANELAAYATVASLILNLDEVVTKE